ncbi:MAG: DUF3137 domain-containing protein [Aquificaceae bacterium]|nr:DUF3137 domain-containing protein [Aquificaceae bacterium]
MIEEDFYKHLEEKLHILEAERRKIISWLLGFVFILVVLSLPLLYYIYTHYGENAFYVTLALAIAIPVLFYFERRKAWSKLFKREFFILLLRAFFPNLTYRAEQYIPVELFVGSMLFIDKPRPDRYTGEDFVEGKVGDTDIAFSEVHAEYKTETIDMKGRKRTNWHTIFKGVLFMAKFPKRAKGVVLVYPDTFRLFGTPAGLERVKLEDPEFEKRFDVFSNDQIEARYILSLSLMRRMLDFILKTGAKVRFSFMDEYMFCAMDFGKDFFEAPSIFHSLYPLIYKEGFKQYVQEVELLISVVEELNLNQRIWL